MRRTAGLLALAAVPTAVLGGLLPAPRVGHGRTRAVAGRRVRPGCGARGPRARATCHVIWFTLWTSTVSTVVAVLLGLPAAYVLHRLAIPLRGAVRAALLVPFVLPTVVVGIAIRELVAESGPLGFLGIDGSPVAILVGLVFFNVAVVIRTVGTAWESLDRRPAEAAAALGASSIQVLRTVTLPALRPAIVSAAAVVFLFCATGSVWCSCWAAPATRRSRRRSTCSRRGRSAGPSSTRRRPRSRWSSWPRSSCSSGSRRGCAPYRTRRYDARWQLPPAADARTRPALVATGLVLVAIATPVVTLVVGSLRYDGAWTLAHYRALQGSGDEAGGSGMGGGLLRVPVTDALVNSLRIAVDATWMSLLLGCWSRSS